MSYKVYAGTQTAVGVWDTKACIYDPTGEDLRTTATLLISPTLTREAGKAGSFEFTLPLGNVAHSALQKLKTIVEVEQDGTPIWHGRVMSHDMDFYLRQKVYCEGELAYLNDTAITPYRYPNISIREFLENVIRNHNSQTDKYKAFTVGDVTVFAEGPQEPFKTVYMRGCVAKYHRDSDDEVDYWLEDADGRWLCDTSRDYDLPAGYINGGSVIRIVSNDGRDPSSPSYVTTYTVERNVAYKNGNFYSLSTVQKDSKYIYTVDTTPLAGWRLTDDGAIQLYNPSTGIWSVCTGYYLHDFDASTNEALDFGDGKNFGTTWDILQSELTDVYGGYLVVRYSDDGKTRYLDYLADVAESNTQTIEFGVNMLDLNNYVKADNIVTRVIAVGYQKKGWWIFKSTKTIQEQADDRAAQSFYGIITRVIVIDGKSITRQKLLDAANEELRKNLRYYDGIEVSAIDLRDAGINTERLSWMKKTRIISKPHGIDTPLVLTKIVEPLDAPDKKKFTFGTSFYSISDLQALSSHKASMAYSIALSSMGYLNGNPIPTTSKTSAQ
nr:MAG TPA: endopeptidase tail [Caudoviricetes sp.]